MDFSNMVISALKNNIIEVDKSFLELTGYKAYEILHKNIDYVFKKILRSSTPFKYDCKNQKSFFIFTKNLEPRELDIKVEFFDGKYKICLCEKPYSRLEVKFPYINQLYHEGKSGIAVYAGNLTLLRANKTYLEFLDEPYNKKENCIGKKVYKIFKEYKKNNGGEIWANILNTGEVYYSDEVFRERLDKGISYWDISIVPIYENGKIKYFIENSHEVTERVLNRKKVEEQNRILELQAEQLRLISENMHDGLYIINKDGTYNYFNETAKKMFINPENIKKIGDSLDNSNYYDENGNKLTKEELPSSRVLKGESIKNNIIHYETINFSADFNYNGSPIYNTAGELTSAILCFRDVTNKINFEREMKKRNSLLETIYNTMTDVLLVTDKAGNILTMNSVAKELLHEPFKKGNIEYNFGNIEYLDLGNNPIPLDQMPHKLASKGIKIDNYKFAVRQEDKLSYIDVKASPMFDENGDFFAAVLCCRDITKSIINEKEMIKQKEQLEAIVKSMSDGLGLVDNKLQITFLNQSAKNFFYNAETKMHAGNLIKYNKYFYGVDGNEIPEYDLPAFKIINEGGFQNYILTIIQPDKKIYVSINGSPIYDSKGRVKEAILCIRDITEQVMKDEALKSHKEIALQAAKDRNEALEKALSIKDEFLSLISHEFKTPLTIIDCALQALELSSKNELSQRAIEYHSKIKQNSYRLQRLVNNLLDITRMSAGYINIKEKSTDIIFLTKSIVDSVQLFACQKGIELKFMTRLNSKIVEIDDEKYERILLNLLSNAIKFTPEGKAIHVYVYKENCNLCIEVKDKGIGIPEDKLEFIFERFGQVDNTMTRTSEGTGIGLSLVKMLIDAIGGSISVKSKIGEGSTFIVRIPDKKYKEILINNSFKESDYGRLVKSSSVELSDI